MQEKYDSGRSRLLELGIRQVLQRPLHWTHSSAVCFCIMSPLTGITGNTPQALQQCPYKINLSCGSIPASWNAGLYQTGLLYGGPVVLIWGWLLTSIMTLAIGLALSELSSAFPVSGGLYFWSFMLAKQYGPVASWVVGYFNLLGQVCFCCQKLLAWLQSI